MKYVIYSAVQSEIYDDPTFWQNTEGKDVKEEEWTDFDNATIFNEKSGYLPPTGSWMPLNEAFKLKDLISKYENDDQDDDGYGRKVKESW